MTFDEVRGIYTPSYFSIRLNTTEELHPLQNVNVKFISTYFHEYFHYLQDLTTSFGLNSAWNTYDRTIRLIKHVQGIEGDIELPIKDDIIKELDKNYNVYCQILASKKPTKIITDKFSIKKIELTTQRKLEGVIPDEANQFVNMELVDDLGVEADFWFGGMAVIETMTYLIQSRFFDTSHSPTFPYKAAIIVAEYLSNQFKGSYEYIFSLCEVSLYSPYPGRTFYEILLEIEQQKIKIASTAQIYDMGFRHVTKKWGLWENLEKYKSTLVEILKSLHGHEAFKINRDWLIYIIEEGAKLRKEQPSLMLELYKSATPFSPLLLDIYKRLGTPETINAENKRWFAAPQALEENADKIHTVFLTGFKQMQNLLLFGKKDCIIINHCEGSKNEMPIDKNCTTSPWLKAKQDPLCPFAALWKSFGLDSKDIILTS
ncbi:MAG TPA: hypothetical protein VLC98_11650 [Phnomibacter sp.]|nr:hypothetical protein [Phnomibacter sp.]